MLLIRWFGENINSDMRRIIFYSSVSDKGLFNTQKFYQIDIDILKQLGYHVILSNSIADAFMFWKYDIVFAYFYRYSFFFAVVALIFGRRTYFTGGIDSLDIEYIGKKQYFIQRMFFRWCYLISKKCFIVSESDLKNVKKVLKTQTSKLVLSEHTINTSSFKLNVSETKSKLFTTLVWMGTDSNVIRKGVDKALLLFSLLKSYPDYKDFKFILMGKKGAGTTFIEKIIQELNISDSVIITGEVSEEEKISYLKQSMFYIQLSHYEGFGVAALEALIAGNIIIHSAKGGLSNPIYSDHVIIDIQDELKGQIECVINRINSIDSDIIYSRVQQYYSHYDNKRRLNDFSRYIS